MKKNLIFNFYRAILERKVYGIGLCCSTMKGVDYVLNMLMLTMIFIIVMLLILLMLKDIGKKILLSFVFVLASIVLFLISFIVGGWEGMVLGAVSISLFVASLIALI